jgi:hypothetical protein
MATISLIIRLLQQHPEIGDVKALTEFLESDSERIKRVTDIVLRPSSSKFDLAVQQYASGVLKRLGREQQTQDDRVDLGPTQAGQEAEGSFDGGRGRNCLEQALGGDHEEGVGVLGQVGEALGGDLATAGAFEGEGAGHDGDGEGGAGAGDGG